MPEKQAVNKYKYYRPFCGTIAEEMPKLLDDQRSLITVEELVKIYFSGDKVEEPVTKYNGCDIRKYWGEQIFVNLAVLDNPDSSGEVKFDIDNPLVYTLNSKSVLEHGVLPITKEQYRGRKGCFILSGDQVEELSKNPCALTEVRRQFWQATIGKDANKFIGTVCEILDLSFNECMGLYFSNRRGMRIVGIQPICVNHDFELEFADENNLKYGDVMHQPLACCGINFDRIYYGGLVGVNQEALSARPNKGLEGILSA